MGVAYVILQGHGESTPKKKDLGLGGHLSEQKGNESDLDAFSPGTTNNLLRWLFFMTSFFAASVISDEGSVKNFPGAKAADSACLSGCFIVLL